MGQLCFQRIPVALLRVPQPDSASLRHLRWLASECDSLARSGSAPNMIRQGWRLPDKQASESATIGLGILRFRPIRRLAYSLALRNRLERNAIGFRFAGSCLLHL